MNRILNAMLPEELSKRLRNIGVVTARQLVEVGIVHPAILRRLGAEEAYRRLCEHEGFCGRYNAVYLYALEGAILDCHWQQIPEERKEAYKALTKQLREALGQSQRKGRLRLPQVTAEEGR